MVKQGSLPGTEIAAAFRSEAKHYDEGSDDMLTLRGAAAALCDALGHPDGSDARSAFLRLCGVI